MKMWVIVVLAGITGISFIIAKARKVDESSTIKNIQGEKTKVKAKAQTSLHRVTAMDIEIADELERLTPGATTNDPILFSRSERVDRALVLIGERETMIQQAIQGEINKEEEPGVKVDVAQLKVLREDAARMSAIKIRMAEARTPAEKSEALADFKVIRLDAAKRMADREGISYYEALRRMGVHVPAKQPRA